MEKTRGARGGDGGYGGGRDRYDDRPRGRVTRRTDYQVRSSLLPVLLLLLLLLLLAVHGANLLLPLLLLPTGDCDRSS